MAMGLNALAAGERGVVSGLTAQGLRRQRWQDLGFVPGAPVQCLFTAAAGDPRAYWICGVCIALRNRDAAEISVVPLERQAEGCAEGQVKPEPLA